MIERDAKFLAWVDALADPERREAAFRELSARGAVRAGLGDERASC